MHGAQGPGHACPGWAERAVAPLLVALAALVQGPHSLARAFGPSGLP